MASMMQIDVSPEIAEMRQVSERTVQRDWQKARLLLHRLLRSPG